MKIVLLGSRPISLFFYKIFKKNIINIVKNKKKEKKYWNKDISNLEKNYFVNLESLKRKFFDLGVSINFNEKIPSKILKRAKIGFINFHYSYSNRIRGRNVLFHTIYNQEKYFGYTIHWMNHKIDSGNLIYTKKFKLRKKYTSNKIFNIIEKDLKFFIKNKLSKYLDYYLNLNKRNKVKYQFYKKKDKERLVNDFLKKPNLKKKYLLLNSLKFKNLNKDLIKKISIIKK